MTNPYAAPEAPVADVEAVGAPSKRPKLVWVIFLFTLFGVCSASFAVYLQLTGQFPAPNEVYRRYLESIPIYMHVATLVLAGLYLAAAIQLFRLKAVALKLYVVHFSAGLVLTAVQLADPHYRAIFGEAGSGSGLIGGAIGWVIALAIIFYCRRLVRRGVLR